MFYTKNRGSFPYDRATVFPLKGYEVFRVQCGFRLPFSGPVFQIPVEVVSTAMENIVLNGYFSKRTDLIVIFSCSLAGFCRSLFLIQYIGGFPAETACKCPWLPFVAITSENLVFYKGLSGFLAVRCDFIFCGVHVRIFQKKSV
jgi:hypothetical protein